MKLDKKSSRTLILVISTFTYLLFGAAVFDKLESETDYELRDELSHIQGHLKKKYNITKKDMEVLETIAIKSIPHKAGLQWNFAGAFYFATVVITTVGYGHSAPETVAGRLFCMVFALAGIPLGLIMFQSIGERVNTGIACILSRIRSQLQQMGVQSLPGITPTHLLVISLSIGTLIIIIGTYVFHHAERWSLFEAFYYCVITLSTIGFGDYVPLQRQGELEKNPGYVVFTLLFVVVGLCVFSACVNLLVLGNITVKTALREASNSQSCSPANSSASFMAPNADAVTAAARDPPRAIVFEKLSPKVPGGRDWMTGRKYSSHTPGSLRQSMDRTDVYSPTVGSIHEPGRRERLIACCLSCCVCGRQKVKAHKKIRYSVKRLPTTNVEHLVHANPC